jgi:transposase
MSVCIAVAYVPEEPGTEPIYLGPPSEYSSGGNRRQGGIAKSGATAIRPGCPRRSRYDWNLCSRRSATLPGRPKYGCASGYRRLSAKGKHQNVITTAIAREMLAFMWAIAKKVQIAESSQTALAR